ncbi:MAG: ATP-dependent Clp protease proteolytic subunit [Parcubacteria group bacterium]|nr:ATP-dependent Clp protease proteolytic subunit [Parcubacteria group bacterium]
MISNDMNEVAASAPKEDKFAKQLKAFVAERKKPALLLRMGTVTPASVILTQNKLRGKNFDELDVILETPGGHIESAYKIVKLLRKHTKRVNIVVPTYAKSAGTLISLAGETLVMATTSELGPLDVQIPEQQEGDVDTFKSALNGYKSLEQIQNHAVENLDIATKLILHRTRNRMRLQDVIKLAIEFSGNTSGCLYNQIHPKSITEYARALDIGEQYGVRILLRYMGWSAEKAKPVIHRMVYDYPSHEFIIDTEELAELGFAVENAKGDLEVIMEALGLSLQIRNHTDEQEIKLLEFTPTPSAQGKVKAKKNNENQAKKTKK